MVALLPGGVISFDEVFDLQQKIRRPFTWTALLTVKGFPYHEKVIERHEQARERGIDVWPQVSCRPLVFQMNMLQPFTMNITRELLPADGARRRAAHRRLPRSRVAGDRRSRTSRPGLPFNWASLSVAESEKFPELVGRKVVDLAAERGCTPLDVVLDISLDDDLQTRFWSVVANDDPDGIAWLLEPGGHVCSAWPTRARTSRSCATRASPPTCSATGSARRRCCRSSGPIHKLTAEPASVYGLADRGTVAVGKAADLCVFDPDTVDPGPLRRLYDFPANGERLTADAPTGMTHVLVNGVPIRVDGAPEQSGARPGVVLRGEHVGSADSTAGRRPGHEVRSGFNAAADRSRKQPRHTPRPVGDVVGEPDRPSTAPDRALAAAAATRAAPAP